MTIYRGFDIENEHGLYVWTDKEGRIRNGRVNGVGGYMTEEQAMDAIDAYRKARAFPDVNANQD